MGRQRALRRAAMTGGGLERHLQALGAAAIEMGESAPFLHQVGGAGGGAGPAEGRGLE